MASNFRSYVPSLTLPMFNREQPYGMPTKMMAFLDGWKWEFCMMGGWYGWRFHMGDGGSLWQEDGRELLGKERQRGCVFCVVQKFEVGWKNVCGVYTIMVEGFLVMNLKNGRELHEVWKLKLERVLEGEWFQKMPIVHLVGIIWNEGYRVCGVK